jgi:hypothetical protein
MLDFLGIGAQKAGTTYLYEKLSENPNVLFPAGKEIHFWNNKNTKMIADYRDIFSDDKNPEYKKGEITPAYALLPTTVIEDVYREYPKLKLIYIIRNPIDRAWSSALMALTRAEMTPEEASDQWFIDHFRSQGSLTRGDYKTCIQAWTRIFPIEQLLILNFDQLESEPKEFLERCFIHIGIEKQSFEASLSYEINQPIFKGLGLSIRPSLLPLLCGLYEKNISSLSLFLNDDFSSWINRYQS